MHALHQHEPRARVVIKLRQGGGIVIRRIPSANHVLVTVRGRVPKIIGVKSVGSSPLLIHVLGRPVAALEIRLRPVVDPHAEFCLPQPRGSPVVTVRVVIGNGLPCRLKRSVRLNRKIHICLREIRRVA